MSQFPPNFVPHELFDAPPQFHDGYTNHNRPHGHPASFAISGVATNYLWHSHYQGWVNQTTIPPPVHVLSASPYAGFALPAFNQLQQGYLGSNTPSQLT